MKLRDANQTLEVILKGWDESVTAAADAIRHDRAETLRAAAEEIRSGVADPVAWLVNGAHLIERGHK